jgi:hypothetical protein
MADSNEFYCPPGSEIEPGDVFLDIPFPSFKHPLTFFRVNPNKDPKSAQVFTPEETALKTGDSPRGSVELRPVMLLSHGCEVERVLRHENPQRRQWLAAPIILLDECNDKMKARTREGTQPNRFFLPAAKFLDEKEGQVDLRKITAINCQYFLDADRQGKRILALSEIARLELHIQIGVFFSGLALYVQGISCPECGALIDPTQFQIPSEGEPDVD